MNQDRIAELLEAYRRADSAEEQTERIAAIRDEATPAPPDPDRDAVDDAACESDPERAFENLAAHFRAAPILRPVTTWRDAPEPPPVLWRDQDGHEGAPAHALISVGETGILAAPGGSGKSYITLALARAAATAHATKAAYGAACGLRVRTGPVVLISYEDSPVRVAARLRAMGDIPADIHCWPDPGPLFEAHADGPGRGRAIPAAAWRPLWDAIGTITPSLVVIDPASAALADVSVSESGPVRAFLAALGREATRIDCGILIVAHDTKAARNEAAAGGDPGAGAIAGSATWHDGARGGLYLRRVASDPGARTMDCIKSNYGPTGWSVELAEQYTDTGRFAGFHARPGAKTMENPYG